VKKKSPPYAIIGAVLLGIVAVAAYVTHEKQVQAAHDKELADLQAKEAADLALANAKQGVTVTPTDTNMREVLYATQPIEPGVRISAAFFEKKQTPKELLPDAYGGDTDIVGWYATRNIEKGDPLTPRNVGKDLPFMSGRITPGMRAVTLNVFNTDQDNFTGGFAVDGDKVDLLYSNMTEDNKYILDTQLVMQNVNVLFVPGSPIKTEKSVGVNPVPTPGATVAVTFEVTPETAQALIFMSQVKNGRFSMILRSRRDTAELTGLKPFTGNYYENLKKVQKLNDASTLRVQALTQQIEALEKQQAAQGKTNETPPPPAP